MLHFVIYSAKAEELITPSIDRIRKKPAVFPTNVTTPTTGDAVLEEVDSRPEIPGEEDDE